MSKVTVKINRIKNKLDGISGLDGKYINTKIDYLEGIVNIVVQDINEYCDKNELNGTIF